MLFTINFPPNNDHQNFQLGAPSERMGGLWRLALEQEHVERGQRAAAAGDYIDGAKPLC